MKTSPKGLSRRERQIMDALFSSGEGTVKSIRRALPDPPSENAVRTLLQIMEDKGLVLRDKQGKVNHYRPRQAREAAASDALRRVLDTFFGGSLEDAVALHFDGAKEEIDPTTYGRLKQLCDEAEDRRGKGDRS